MLNFVANTISKPTYPLYWEGRQKDNGNALYIMVSNRSKLKNYFINSDKINLVYQFFIHKNEERNKELRYCLKTGAFIWDTIETKLPLSYYD